MVRDKRSLLAILGVFQTWVQEDLKYFEICRVLQKVLTYVGIYKSHSFLLTKCCILYFWIQRTEYMDNFNFLYTSLRRYGPITGAPGNTFFLSLCTNIKVLWDSNNLHL